ncbi:peptide chain release factor N(5)-glutamine methyltransferase [Candidatus Dependentiae bacterium]|nr:MAG: peptide chain release factor N(5)-glutamine methyltransferase [Candidatus Dependentiae bacterium]
MIRTDKAITFIHEIERQLRTIYEDPTLCRQYAWWILEEITHHKKEDLLADHIIQLSHQHQAILNQWLDKLINKKMPLQYLIGAVPFNNIEILVEPPILIPRPETEEWTIRLIKQLKQLKNQELTILDIGSGSGCIALAIAHALPKATIYATDIATNAIALTQKNALHNGISNIKCIKADIYDGLPLNLKFDLILSNPPYISPNEWEQLEESVTRWEDKAALVANKEGLAIIEAIIKQACYFMKYNSELEEKKLPNVVLEIGYKQADAITTLMKQAGFSTIKIEKDLEEKDRVVSGRVVPCGQYKHATTTS